jgi:hypothetical protein
LYNAMDLYRVTNDNVFLDYKKFEARYLLATPGLRV